MGVIWVTGHPPNLKFLKSHPPYLQWSPIDTHPQICAKVLCKIIRPIKLVANENLESQLRNLAAKAQVENIANVALKGFL